MNEQITRGPGRPAKQTVSVIKKGKPMWHNPSLLDVQNKDPNYEYRFVNKDPSNLAKKELNWDYVSGLQADGSKLTESGRMNDGKQMTSIIERRDTVLMRTPKENYELRQQQVAEKTAQRTRGLTAHLKKEIREKGGNAPIHGGITIGSLAGGEDVID